MSTIHLLDSLAPFRTEILSEALAICRGRRVSDLRQPRIAHLHGVMALQRGDLDLAIAYLTHAIRRDLSAPSPYSDLGAALLRKGRVTDATAAHLRALTLAPGDPERYRRLGRVLRDQGRKVEAKTVYQEALRLAPDAPDVHGELGDLLCAEGRLHEAVVHHKMALRLAPHDVTGHCRLGRAWLELGELNQAVAEFRQGLKLQPDRADLHVELGEALLRLGALEEAAGAFYTALTISPHNIAANRQFVIALELLGRRADALGGWINLGDALEAHGRFEEASAAYRQAVFCKRDSLKGLVGLARAHSALGQPREAIRRLEAALASDPEHAQAHTNLGLVLQQVEEFGRGWNELAWYHHPTSEHWRHLGQPVWDGLPLEGRTLLLWTDDQQGDGEIIQFLRYIRFANEHVGRVMLECRQALVPLARNAIGLDDVIATGGPLLPFDVHAPLRYFPALVKAARSTFGLVPYLSVPEERQRSWRQRLARDHARLIGIAWAGRLQDGDTPRQIASLSAFAPLAAIDGIRLISLQSSLHRDELLSPPPRLRVQSCLGNFCSIANLAAAIINLDLVITVDPVLAHLAGALGRPVWTLLSYGAGWPWPSEGNETPWYPTMRLFRQTRFGDWTGVLESVRAALSSALDSAAAESEFARSSDSCATPGTFDV